MDSDGGENGAEDAGNGENLFSEDFAADFERWELIEIFTLVFLSENS